MSQASVLTVILNFRTADLAIRAAAAALRDMADIPGNVLVIDNASGDGSLRRIDQAITANGWNRDHGIALLQSGVNGGYGAGNNIGIRAGLMDDTSADFIYILNSDATPDPGAIATLRDFLITNPKAGMAASHVRGSDDAPHCTAFRFPSIAGEFEGAARTGVITRLMRNAVVALPIPDRATQVDWSAGASLMLRREMLDQIGTFDETFFLYFEETDLCRRAARAGWQVWYLPESRVVHVGSASTGMKNWQRTPGYWFDSRLHYFVKNHGPTYACAATLAHIAGAVVYRLRRLVSDRPQADPPHFLRDLIAHSIRAIRPRRATLAARPSPLIEDPK